MIGVMGPIQTLNPWEYLATSSVNLLMPCSVGGTCKQGKGHHFAEGESTAVDRVWDPAQMEDLLPPSLWGREGPGGSPSPKGLSQGTGRRQALCPQGGGPWLEKANFSGPPGSCPPGVATGGNPYGGGLWMSGWPQTSPWVLVPHPFISGPVHMASASLHRKGSADLGPSSPG